ADVFPRVVWRTVVSPAGSLLFDGAAGEGFDVAHSYAARGWEMEPIGAMTPPMVTWAEHGGARFIAAVENGALCATQFHPEKSGAAGAALLANWLRTLPRHGREG